MDKRQKVRWTILISSLTVTVGAIVYPIDEPMAEGTNPARRTFSAAQPKPALDKERAVIDPAPQWMATDEDPFEPRGWGQTQSPAAVPPSPQPLPVVVTEPASLPLPYKVLGQMSDGADHIVYLKAGEQVLLARAGEVLEGNYRVVAVTGQQIEFESVNSGIRQSLPLSSADN
jgi:hypothetical protein